MYRKKAVFCFFITILLIVLISCKSNNYIKVSSYDYNGLKRLKEGDFSKETALTWGRPENPYDNYTCYVTVKNDELLISNSEPSYLSDVMPMNNGYFVGVDLGEFDGWVRYFPYYSAYPESGESFVVANENFGGFIKIDNNSGFAITYTYTMTPFDDGEGKVYYLSLKQKEWTYGTAITFSGIPRASSYVESEHVIYIVTTESILSYSVESQELSVLTESTLLNYIGTNSVVKLNNNIYCGSPMGIYEYSLATGEERWYPMDYEQYPAVGS